MAAKKVECVSDVPSCLVLLNSPTCPTRHSLSLSPFPRVIAPCSAHDDLFSLHQGFVPPGQPPSPSSAVFSLELLLVAAGSREFSNCQWLEQGAETRFVNYGYFLGTGDESGLTEPRPTERDSLSRQPTVHCSLKEDRETLHFRLALFASSFNCPTSPMSTPMISGT
ncbi:hypothetical protein LSTR_LSTR000445 [Laodelphax striatellus]|uniref:Uncharacterized protein n=1 Tax=Laodelphax striatellus TaxID=195883 RepID=A0A482X1P3_LAOST|nr:hypothetical protein LSTR_LSTR000445 [Laodelphax striatellus]